MIRHQQKSKKHEGTVRLKTALEIPPQKGASQADGNDMAINPALDKFSGDEFIPEKYKEAEALLANSSLPHSSSSSK